MVAILQREVCERDADRIVVGPNAELRHAIRSDCAGLDQEFLVKESLLEERRHRAEQPAVLQHLHRGVVFHAVGLRGVPHHAVALALLRADAAEHRRLAERDDFHRVLRAHRTVGERLACLARQSSSSQERPRYRVRHLRVRGWPVRVRESVPQQNCVRMGARGVRGGVLRPGASPRETRGRRPRERKGLVRSPVRKRGPLVP